MTEGVFSHKDTKFHYARVLLHPTPSGAPSRREPSFDLCARPMCILKICFAQNYCKKLNICEPSPVGEGVKRSLTDEESREKDNFQSLPLEGGGIAKQ